MVSSERASQEEQNGADFRFVAPSIEGLWVHKDITRMCVVKVVTLTKKFDAISS